MCATGYQRAPKQIHRALRHCNQRLITYHFPNTHVAVVATSGALGRTARIWAKRQAVRGKHFNNRDSSAFTLQPTDRLYRTLKWTKYNWVLFQPSGSVRQPPCISNISLTDSVSLAHSHERTRLKHTSSIIGVLRQHHISGNSNTMKSKREVAGIIIY